MSIQDDEIQNDILGEQFDLSCIENLSSILAQVPDQEPPVIKREARYLSGNDIGKTVSVIIPGFNGEPVTDEIWHVYQMHNTTEIVTAHSGTARVPNNTQVTITGKEQGK